MDNVYYIYQIILTPCKDSKNDFFNISYIGQTKSQKLVERMTNHLKGNSKSSKIIHNAIKSKFHNYYVSEIRILKKIIFKIDTPENKLEGIACNFENLAYSNYNLGMLDKDLSSDFLSFGAYNTKVYQIKDKPIKSNKKRFLKKLTFEKLKKRLLDDWINSPYMKRDRILAQKKKALTEINRKLNLEINTNDLEKNVGITNIESDINNFEDKLLSSNQKFEMNPPFKCKKNILTLSVTPENHSEVIQKIENI